MKKTMFAVLALFFACQQRADFAIINAKVFTVEKEQPLAEAVAIAGNRILAVGWLEQIQPLIDQHTEIYDAEGRLVIPGFNDAHLHFLSGGLNLTKLDLSGCRSMAEIETRLSRRVDSTPRGEWITGRGWDHTLFNEGRWPDKQQLDRIAPHHPVLLRRIDGHVAWANSAALAAAAVGTSTPDPDGGEIQRDPVTREPTGILKETAAGLVSRLVPPPSREEKRQAIVQALKHAAALGVTSIQDNSGEESLSLYQELQAMGALNLRVTEWLSLDLAADSDSIIAAAERCARHCDGEQIRLGLLKGFVDGTLGSRTALFFEPYEDDASTYGLAQMSLDRLTRLVCTADSLGWQIGLHCIGSKANWMALRAYGEANRRYGERDRRHRLEHAQVLRPHDFALLHQTGVIASMQPTHCSSDLRWAEARIGANRCLGAYAWRTILRHQGRIAFGTDWPVEPLDPMRGLYAATTRRNIESGAPESGWFPQQKLTMAEAIRLYTLDSAYAEFQENVKGSLAPGKAADLVVLSRDLLTVSEDEILDTRVDLTLFDGRVVYRREGH